MTYSINVIISKYFFNSKIYLFVGHQYFDYVYKSLKLFGPGPKSILIRASCSMIKTIVGVG